MEPRSREEQIEDEGDKFYHDKKWLEKQLGYSFKETQAADILNILNQATETCNDSRGLVKLEVKRVFIRSCKNNDIELVKVQPHHDRSFWIFTAVCFKSVTSGTFFEGDSFHASLIDPFADPDPSRDALMDRVKELECCIGWDGLDRIGRIKRIRANQEHDKFIAQRVIEGTTPPEYTGDWTHEDMKEIRERLQNIEEQFAQGDYEFARANVGTLDIHVRNGPWRTRSTQKELEGERDALKVEVAQAKAAKGMALSVEEIARIAASTTVMAMFDYELVDEMWAISGKYDIEFARKIIDGETTGNNSKSSKIFCHIVRALAFLAAPVEWNREERREELTMAKIKIALSELEAIDEGPEEQGDWNDEYKQGVADARNLIERLESECQQPAPVAPSAGEWPWFSNFETVYFSEDRKKCAAAMTQGDALMFVNAHNAEMAALKAKIKRMNDLLAEAKDYLERGDKSAALEYFKYWDEKMKQETQP